jgi:hypothetical protein
MSPWLEAHFTIKQKRFRFLCAIAEAGQRLSDSDGLALKTTSQSRMSGAE